MAGLEIFGCIVVVGLVAVVALVVGGGFRGKIGSDGGSIDVDGR